MIGYEVPFVKKFRNDFLQVPQSYSNTSLTPSNRSQLFRPPDNFLKSDLPFFFADPSELSFRVGPLSPDIDEASLLPIDCTSSYVFFDELQYR